MTHPEPRVGRWALRLAIGAVSDLLLLASACASQLDRALHESAWKVRRWRDRRFPL